MKKLNLILTLLSLFVLTYGCSKDNSSKQNKYNPVETEVTLNSEGFTIYGSLKLPNTNGQFPLVLIIAGSGPTDRDGNSTSGLNTNCYKLISDTLAMQGIASLRYDKRGIAKSYIAGFNEANLTFDNYVTDAKNWIQKFKSDNRFSKIFILGHSEGALIGSIVANQISLDGFISVAGTAQRADSLILQQLSSQPDYIINESRVIIDSLNKGILVSNVDQTLYSLFRPSVQPYLISWFKYNPKIEMSKIRIAILILHGTTDLQVNYSEANQLGTNNTNAKVVIIDNMNHILKNSSSNYQENMATYSNPKLPLSVRFSIELIGFINMILNK
jgi:uncharacterized protein